MTREIRFNVGGDVRDDVPRLQPDRPEGHPVIVCTFEGPGRLLAVIPETCTGGATMRYQYGAKWFRIILPPLGDQGQWEAGEWPCLPPEYHGDPDLVALHYTWTVDLIQPVAVGRYYRLNGDRIFLNLASGFAGYQRFLLEGADAIRPVLAQRRDLGFISTRTWTAYDIPNIGRLIPREHPYFYDRMEDFSSLCAEYGQYPYWTVYAGANAETLGDHQAMVDHQHRMEDALLAIGFGFLDLHNEKDHPLNAPSNFTEPVYPLGVDYSEGSNMQDVDPPLPLGAFYARHPGSGSEVQRKVGKQNYDYARDHQVHIPGIDDECWRVEDTGTTEAVAHDAGACAAFFCAGACFHSAAGKLFQPWTGGQLAAARAWCDGVRWVIGHGLDVAQDGSYTNLDPQQYLRRYQRQLGARAVVLEIRHA